MSQSPPVEVPLRQCARCRGWFDGDPDAHPTAQAEWWACQPCRDVVLAGPRARPAT
jgi:hypothetical protein